MISAQRQKNINAQSIKEFTFYQDASDGTTGKYDHEMVNFMPKQHDNSSVYRHTAENPGSKSLVFEHKLLEQFPRQCCSGTKHEDI